eukprot:COSAG06_NODE_895_length_11669_cov_5.131384_10_plen_126_part_00
MAAALLLLAMLLLLSTAAANDPVSPAELRNLTKCCHWSERLECQGDPEKDWLCPLSCKCGEPGWMPKSWAAGVASGSILVAPPDMPGATVQNGYVGAWVPRSLPGTAGPPWAGFEHVSYSSVATD